jgi:hypothetical protein
VPSKKESVRNRGEEKKGKNDKERNTDLAILVRFANVEERASAALVLFTAYDRMHRT